MHSLFNKAKTLTLVAFSAGVAIAAPTIEIGKWGNFCKGAISHTFDDNCPRQLTIAAPAFENVGMRMTIFVVTGTGVADAANWDGLKQAAAKGHEIGSHAVTHPSGSGVPMSASDFGPSQTTIQQKTFTSCVSLAYPNCTIVTGSTQHYIAARTCYKGEGLSEATPANWESIDSKMVGCSGCFTSATEMNAFAKSAADGNKWAVTCHHGIEGDGHGWANTAVTELKSHLDYLKQNSNTIWCETFGNVARYIKERDAATTAVTSSDDKTIKLTLKDNLEDATYNYPLSLRTELPAGWTDAVVTQGGKVMKDTIVTDGSKKYLMFQAVPDAGEIVVDANPSSIKAQRKLLETGKMLWIDNNRLSVNSAQFTGSDIAVSIFNLTGKVLAKYSLNNSESSIALPLTKLGNETFFVKVTDGIKTYTEKVTQQL